MTLNRTLCETDIGRGYLSELFDEEEVEAEDECDGVMERGIFRDIRVLISSSPLAGTSASMTVLDAGAASRPDEDDAEE